MHPLARSLLKPKPCLPNPPIVQAIFNDSSTADSFNPCQIVLATYIYHRTAERRNKRFIKGGSMALVGNEKTLGQVLSAPSRPLRIAQIAPLYESVPPKLYGGTERIVAYLAEELV